MMAEEKRMTRVELIEEFLKRFGDSDQAVRVFYAPGRVNLIGEHTDYNGGHVFPCALTLGIEGVFRLRGDRTVRLASLNEADVIRTFSLDDPLVLREEDGWVSYVKGVLWAFQMRGCVIPEGFEMLIEGDLPAGAGLSSSAALEVLTGMAVTRLYELQNVNEIEIAVLSQRAESKFVGMNCGIMDQFASAMGRKGCAILLNTDRIRYEYVPLHLGDAKIVITNSKVKHSLVDSAYNTRRTECGKALKKLQLVSNINHLCDLDVDKFESTKDVIMNDTYTKRARHVIYENARAIRAVSALRVGNLKRFGELMNQSHISLRDDYEVSCPEIDFLVKSAWKIDGVIGSRLTGAGFGGSTVSIVRGEAVETFREQLTKGYQDRFNMTPDFYVVEAGDGVREIP